MEQPMNRRNALQMLAGATTLMATARPALVAAQAKPFVLPPLPYGYDALEPHIDTQTMTIHHKGHHNAYVTGLNAQIEKFPDLTSKPLDRILADMASVPEAVRTAVRNNGGGHWNHTFFWTLMTPGGAKAPTGNLESAINGTFGSREKMAEAFDAAARTRFGSGWAWLAVTKDKKLAVLSTANQDTPHMEGHLGAVLGIDVWEHAYYLKHQNRRPDYIKAWWNTVNWDKAAESFKAYAG
jgi:superoxide dismutase, Fe-Mn family